MISCYLKMDVNPIGVAEAWLILQTTVSDRFQYRLPTVVDRSALNWLRNPSLHIISEAYKNRSTKIDFLMTNIWF